MLPRVGLVWLFAGWMREAFDIQFASSDDDLTLSGGDASFTDALAAIDEPQR